MKKLLISALFLTLFILNGCNDIETKSSKISNNMNSNNIENVDKKISMKLNKKYRVNRGDIIEKISENPEMQIDSNLEDGITEVTLLSGEASIIRK